MEWVILVLAIIAATIAVLWWVNRHNPGAFRRGDETAPNHMEQRKNWGPK